MNFFGGSNFYDLQNNFDFFFSLKRLAHQLLRRAAAAAAALRRERNNSSQSEELSLKRQRSDNGNNNSPDVISHMPQVTAADFSTIKHNNNNTPPMKDAERAEDYSSDRK